MHAVHLPPRDLWRSALLAALLALVFTLALLMAIGQLPSQSSSGSAPESRIGAPQAPPSVATPSRDDAAGWLAPLSVPAPLVQAAQAR